MAQFHWLHRLRADDGHVRSALIQRQCSASRADPQGVYSEPGEVGQERSERLDR